MFAHRLCCLLALLGRAIVPTPAGAIDGVLEINQACVAGGCFPGDAPGLPVEITSPGSYRLTGNVASTGTSTALLDVNSDDVTIDLNGFTLRGPSLRGVLVRSDFARTEVRNGVVRDNIVGISVNDESRVERVRAFNNTEGGIATGFESIVARCVVAENGFAGILGRGVIHHNLVSGNTNEGIRGRGTITENVVLSNGGTGINAGPGSMVSRNVAVENGQTQTSAGIVADTGSAVVDNVATGNTGVGLDLVSAIGPDAGYARNVVAQNTSNSANPQVNGGIEMGPNVCGTNTTCP
jgi:hypothetical protein